MKDKQIVLNIVKKMDDNISYDEILEKLYVQSEILKGIKDMEEGRMKKNEEVKEIINKW